MPQGSVWRKPVFAWLGHKRPFTSSEDFCFFEIITHSGADHGANPMSCPAGRIPLPPTPQAIIGTEETCVALAYLTNSYPVTSGTFVRDEIRAIERQGIPVHRFAVRQWDQTLVDPRDEEERARTHYLLTGNLTGLVRDGLVELVCNPAGFFRTLALAARLRWRAGRGFVRHAAYFLEAIAFKREAKARGIDHVHVHFSTNATAVAMLAQTLGGPGYSFTVHGPDELLDPAGNSLALKVERARFVVAITHFCRSQLIWFAGHDCAAKIQVMRCGIDVKAHAVAPPISSENQTFVCLGRLCPQKGQAMLPAIVARLREDTPGLKLVLIGGGDLQETIEAEIARYGVGDAITLTGYMKQADALKHVADARALLLPSAAEGLPIVIMEAMALGKPVISTYIAGIPELLDGNTGWIIPAGDEGAIEAAMRAALAASTETLAAMGREGRARVTQHHTIDRLAAQLIAAFRQHTTPGQHQ